MLLISKTGLNVSYGAVIAAIIGYTTSILISLIVLNKKYKFNFDDTIKKIPGYIISWSVFIITICLLKKVIPTNFSGRLIQIPILGVFGILSFGIYGLINYYNGNLTELFNIRRNKNENRNSK